MYKILNTHLLTLKMTIAKPNDANYFLMYPYSLRSLIDQFSENTLRRDCKIIITCKKYTIE